MPQHNLTGKTVALLLVAAALYGLGHALRHTTSCFLLSFVIAYLLDPCVMFLQNRKLSRTNSIGVVYVAVGLLGLFGISFLAPILANQWKVLAPSFPFYLQKAKALGLELQGRFYGAEEWNWVYNQVVDTLDQLLSQLGTAVYGAAASVIFNLFNLILSPILVFFMLHYKKEIKATLAGFIPPGYRTPLLELGRQIDDSIGGYLRGQVVISVIVATLSGAALALLDVDYPVLNGIFAGLASCLPFIGVVIATLPPLFLAYLKFQTGLVMIKVLVFFAVIYFLEGYLVKPLVFRSSMDLNPLLTIITVMALGELFGFWGIILSIPVAAALKLLSVSVQRGDFRQQTMNNEQAD